MLYHTEHFLCKSKGSQLAKRRQLTALFHRTGVWRKRKFRFDFGFFRSKIFRCSKRKNFVHFVFYSQVFKRNKENRWSQLSPIDQFDRREKFLNYNFKRIFSLEFLGRATKRNRSLVRGWKLVFVIRSRFSGRKRKFFFSIDRFRLSKKKCF